MEMAHETGRSLKSADDMYCPPTRNPYAEPLRDLFHSLSRREFPADDDVLLRTVRLYASDGDANGEVMDEQRVWVRRPVNDDEQYRHH